MTETLWERIGLRLMRRSKLEMHVDILKALACNGRLKPTHIMYKANISCNVLKQCLKLLIQQDLVKEQILHKKRDKTRVVYTITEKGLTALKNVWEIYNALQMTEETNTQSIVMLDRAQSITKQDFHLIK